MKNSVIILILIALAGCASTNNVVKAVPAAAGTVVTTAIFGGTVGVNPDPVGYIAEDVNRETRVAHNDARRKTAQAIADSISLLLSTAK